MTAICDGKNSALGFKVGDTVANTDVVDLVSESMINEKEVFDGSGSLIGGRQLNIADAVCLKESPAGSFTFRPRYADIIPTFLLALSDGTTTPVPVESGELDVFAIKVSKAAAYCELYTGCVVNQLKFVSEQNNPAEITIDALAKTCASSTLTPDYTSIAGVAMVLHSDLTLGGDAMLASQKVYKVELTIKNNVDSELYANSKTRSVLQGGQFEVDLALDLDLTATLAGLWATKYNAKTQVQVELTYDGGTPEFTISFNGIISNPLPQISSAGIQRATMQLSGRAIKSAAGAVTTNMISLT